MSSKVRKELRNLLRAIEDYHENSIQYVGKTIMDVLGQHINAAYTALAEPLRNCDIGTADEQEDRFADFCRKHECTMNCPIKKKWSFRCGHKPSCGVLWSQMPYEEVK